MPPHIINPDRVQPFPTEAAFEEWLVAHHATDKEVWIRIYKKGSGVPTITPVQAIDVALCWGWIDGARKGLDETSFLQRYTPRRAKSAWSQINRDSVARLTAAGRMKPQGQRQVDRARADGRLDTADPPMRNASETFAPADLRVASDAALRALENLESPGRPKVFELASRTNGTKTAAGRAKKNAGLGALTPGGTIVPERAVPERTLPKRAARAKAKPAQRKAGAPKRPAPAKAKAKAKAKPAQRKAGAPKRPASAKAKPAQRKAGAPKRPASAKAKPTRRKAGAPKRPPSAPATGAAKRAAASKRPLKAKAKKSKAR